jgi:large subunit ribosomal protein L5
MVHGMDITFVTTAERDDEALALLSAFGMPFRRQPQRQSVEAQAS